MTTSVKVSAHCSDDLQVRIFLFKPGVDTKQTVIRSGDVYEQVIYGDMTLSIGEELRPVLTMADADADLAGTPRPAR